MISQTAEYALRAVVWLAHRPGESTSTQAIAAGTQVPAHYLSKVLQNLAHSGLVQSRPGRTGGFALARAPKEITVLEVVNAVDPIRRILECPLGIHGRDLCALHRRLDDAFAVAEDAFSRSLIAELLPSERGVDSLCPGGAKDREAR